MRAIPGMEDQDFLSDADYKLREKGPNSFVWAASRKKAAMLRLIEWGEAHAPPTIADIRARFPNGPDNDSERKENKFHAFCSFHNCVNDDCRGIH